MLLLAVPAATCSAGAAGVVATAGVSVQTVVCGGQESLCRNCGVVWQLHTPSLLSSVMPLRLCAAAATNC